MSVCACAQRLLPMYSCGSGGSVLSPKSVEINKLLVFERWIMLPSVPPNPITSPNARDTSVVEEVT